MSFADIAKAMIKRGVYVVPTYPGLRQPALKNWQNLATLDPAQVEQWNNENPNYNCVSVAKNDGVAMLDIDNVEAAKRRGMPHLPRTLLVKTPSGGLHAYLKQTRASQTLGNRTVREAQEPVIEFKAHNTAVCSPGCTRDDGGQYVIVDYSPIAAFPMDLVEWLIRETDVKTNKGTPKPVAEDFDFDAFCEFYGVEIVHVDGPWHSPRICPVKGDRHTNITDCAFRWDGEYLGWKDHAASCDGASMTIGQLIKFLNEEKGEPYPGPIWREREGFEVVDLGETSSVEESKVETESSDGTFAVGANSSEEVKSQIDEIMRTPAKDMIAREKSRTACDLILKNLLANGKLYNCGNVATYVDHSTRELIEVVKGGQKFGRLLVNYGVYPGDKLAEDVGKFLGACAVKTAKNTIYTMSFYNRERHLLYVNEYRGSFLKIDGEGKVTRLRNGDDDMLFADGEETQCDPLHADLEAVNRKFATDSGKVTADVFEAIINSRGLYPGDDRPYTHRIGSGPREGSLITKHILDTINYPEEGVGRDNAHAILMTALLALFFQERIRSMPYVYLYGPGASMKSSLAVKVGRLIQGHRFRPRPATSDEKALKDMAISLPFLVLDEANSVKKLIDLLKTIATGGMDTRRELYTTANVRHTPYQARIWMTANTASLTNETISSRMMIIDAGPRGEQEPYRSEHYLEWSAEQRNAIWTELVERLSGAMSGLTEADAMGEGDLSIGHRMSSFFVFGRAIARREGWEDKFMAAVSAMTVRQEHSSAETDIVWMLERLPASYNIQPNGSGYRTAEEWAQILSGVVPEANAELRRAAARAGWVRHQFTANRATLVKRLGMKTTTALTAQKNRINVYGFARCAGDDETAAAEGALGAVFSDE
jgi:hypothetical protein